MPGRTYNSTSYRAGFNGMEKDDEVKGTGNSYDFGARIYDPRLGRFLSIDPLYKSFPQESPYIFAGNNPIYYIDKNGEVKTTYVTLIAKDGSETTIKIVEEDKVKKVANPKGLGNYFGIALIPGYDYKDDYDMVEFVTLNLQTGERTTTGEIKTTPTKGAFGKLMDWIDTPTQDADQDGGVHLVSKEMQGAFAKYGPKSPNALKSINIDEFLGNLRGGAKLSGPIDKFVEVTKTALDLGGAIGDAVNAASGNDKANVKTLDYCPYCKTAPHGTKRVIVGKDGEPRDTVPDR